MDEEEKKFKEEADEFDPDTDDCMSEKEFSFEPIRYLEIEIKEKRRNWLAKYGWKYKCDFIDGGWRWCKTIDGVPMTCDEDEAINIEYNYIQEAPAAP